MAIPGTICTYPMYVRLDLSRGPVAQVLNSIDWLPQSRLFATIPSNPLIPPGSAALVVDDVTVRGPQCIPIVQGHKYSMPDSSLRLVPTSSPSRLSLTLTSSSTAHRDISMSLSHRGLRIIVRNPLESSFPPNKSFLNSRRYVVKQVERIQEPIADDALRGAGGHVRAIDRILGGFRRRHLLAHKGMVQRARSCHSLSARLATDFQCHSSHQRQY